jgi:hypothetical protein
VRGCSPRTALNLLLIILFSEKNAMLPDVKCFDMTNFYVSIKTKINDRSSWNLATQLFPAFRFEILSIKKTGGKSNLDKYSGF